MLAIEKALEDAAIFSRPAAWQTALEKISANELDAEINHPAEFNLTRLARLLSPLAQNRLPEICAAARQLTLQRFGNAVTLFAPLYVSNHCQNRCLYCGFNAGKKVARARLSLDQAKKEAACLKAAGFSDLLLVSGEDPQFASVDYFVELAKNLRHDFPALAAEIYPLKQTDYAKLQQAGIEGITMFQETYDPQLYPQFHPSGPKADYRRRLAAIEAAAAAGMRQIGLGALLGLGNWRFEALALGLHAHILRRRHWQAKIAFSLPRLRPLPGENPTWLQPITEQDLCQLIAALRLCFPDAVITLSTRESAGTRDALLDAGVTRLSAGSSTSPGGYRAASAGDEQFDVADARSAAAVATMLKKSGRDPVFKDWDAAFAR